MIGLLPDVIRIFKEQQYEKYGEAIIVDSYVPVDGEYIIVDSNSFNIIERVHIKQDKKTKEIDRTNQYFDFICQVDYMSMYLNSNKAFSDKNIHSNNYLTFFVKKENVHNGKITDEIIAEYYAKLKNPLQKYKSKAAKELYEVIEKQLGKPDEKEIEKIETWIKENIYSLVTADSKDKSYLKIFFKYDLATYKKESERYVQVNIYNSNDYNQMIGEKVWGLPDDNMGLNAKKPYLENKTRKTAIPYLVDQEEVLIQKKLFDYLSNLVAAGKYNVYVTEEEGVNGYTNDNLPDKDISGYFLRLQKGIEVEIHDFDVIGLYKVKIKPFTLQNILDLEESKLQYITIEKLTDLKNLINEVFFFKFLTANYFTEPKDIRANDSSLKRNILLARTTLFRWFYKGNDNGAWKVLDYCSRDLIKGSIDNGYLQKASEQFNLRFSLKGYFEGGEDMPDVLLEVKNSLRTKINSKTTDFITNDTEYYFAVGQLTRYLLSLSKTKKKVHSLANPIINTKTDEKLKEQLKRLYKKYNYDIGFYAKRLDNLYSMVSSYVPEGLPEEDLIIAGYLHSNLIYEKSGGEEKEDE